MSPRFRELCLDGLRADSDAGPGGGSIYGRVTGWGAGMAWRGDPVLVDLRAFQRICDVDVAGSRVRRSKCAFTHL